MCLRDLEPDLPHTPTSDAPSASLPERAKHLSPTMTVHSFWTRAQALLSPSPTLPTPHSRHPQCLSLLNPHSQFHFGAFSVLLLRTSPPVILYFKYQFKCHSLGETLSDPWNLSRAGAGGCRHSAWAPGARSLVWLTELQWGNDRAAGEAPTGRHRCVEP